MKTLLLSFCFLFSLISYGQVYEDLPSEGEIEITLHPGISITPGNTQLIAFGVPFPRNLVNDISQIKLTDNEGNETASDIKELTRWHSLSNNPNVSGVRAALLYVNVEFNTLDPKIIKVKYGENRQLELGPQGNLKDTWDIVQDVNDEYIDDVNNPDYVEIKEPKIYATLPSDWMNKCVIRSKFIPNNQVSLDYQWYDESLLNFGRTAINDVADTVDDANKINILQRAPWLYDRAGSLWNVYFKTGDLKWLKAAHRASQFYASKIDERGIFELASWDDLKYSYGGSMLIDLMLSGDETLIDKIKNVAGFAERENFTLREGYNFWTERHFTYWFLGALSAYEATGEEQYKTQVNERAAHAFFRAENPIDGYTPEGGLIHPMGPHEGVNDPRPEFLPNGNPNPYYDPNDANGYIQPIISPWLSALLADAIWRYYLHSEDDEALHFLIGLGENVARHCIYEVEGVHPNIDGNIQTYYLISGQTEDRYLNNQIYWKPWDDNEHALDVMGLLARTVWAQKKLGFNSDEIEPKFNQLLNTANYTIQKWIRNDPSRPKYRLTPPRKFNWQYGTTNDMEWLMTNDPNGTLGTASFDPMKSDTPSIYPNPSNNKTTIRFNNPSDSDGGKIELLDISGQAITSYHAEKFHNNTLDVTKLNAGVYFIRLINKNINHSIKLIKRE